MEPFDNYGLPQPPADETPMNGQTSLPFYASGPAPAGPAPTKRAMFGRVGKPRRTVIAGVTVVVLAATGGVALAAANNNPTPTPGAPGAAMMHGRGGPLHGVFTVADGKGGYQTDLMQNGTVQSFSGGTLVVKSTDGYTHSYTTDSTTVFGRGGHGGHGMRGGNWGRGPMHGKFGNLPNGTAVPNGAAMPNGTAPNTATAPGTAVAPNATAPSTATAPSATAPQANTALPNNAIPNNAMPNNAMPNNATTTAPTLTVGQNVMVIAVQGNGSDHATRVMPMRMPNQNGQNGNGQHGNGGFFGHHRGFGGMNGQLPGGMNGQSNGTAQPGNTGGQMGQMGTGQMGNGPMNGGPMGMGNGQMGQMGGGQMNGGPVNLPNSAPSTSTNPATPQSSAGATAQSTGPADATNG